MKKLLISPFFIFFSFYSIVSFAQNVTVLPGGIAPVQNCIYPRLNYESILALPSPQTGDIAYDLTFLCLRVYNGGKWLCTYQNASDPTSTASLIATASGGEEAGYGIAVDSNGNIYITGYFSGTTNFGGISKTSVRFGDIFVAKYNSSGMIQWVQTTGGINGDTGLGIAVDGSGNVYVTGEFQGTVNFDGISKTSLGYIDMFVAKYDSSGIIQWVETANGTDYEGGREIAVDESGNIYITGGFNVEVNFDGTSKTSAGDEDIFIAKYNSNGILQWVKTAGGTHNELAQGIGIDGSGNVYITGNFNSHLSFGSIFKIPVGNQDIFIAKYNSSGTLLWVQTAGGTSYNSGLDIVVDSSGNSYITGHFTGTTNFGGISKTSVGSNALYIAKYSSSGTIQWVQTAGGSESVSGLSIAINGSGNICVTGELHGQANFWGISKTAAPGSDIFVVRVQ